MCVPFVASDHYYINTFRGFRNKLSFIYQCEWHKMTRITGTGLRGYAQIHKYTHTHTQTQRWFQQKLELYGGTPNTTFLKSIISIHTQVKSQSCLLCRVSININSIKQYGILVLALVPVRTFGLSREMYPSRICFSSSALSSRRRALPPFPPAHLHSAVWAVSESSGAELTCGEGLVCCCRGWTGIACCRCVAGDGVLGDVVVVPGP